MGGIKIIKAETCSENDCVKDIAKKMNSKRTRRFFVINDKNELKGVLTTVDLLKVIINGMDVKKTSVGDVMTKDVKFIKLDDSVDEALKIMNDLRTFVCPVVNEGKFSGIVAYQDILQSVVDEARR